MTSPRTKADPDLADRAQTLLDWTRVNATALTAGAVVIVIVAAGYWFVMRSRQIRETNADKALTTAKQSLVAGNLALAQSDLQKVYSQYGNTLPGVEAAVSLAEIDYDSGKIQDGISLLEKVAGSGAASPVETSVRSLIGDGYMQMHKPADAAKAYESAAATTAYENEKASETAKAARAYQAAGDTAKARQIWTALANDPKAQALGAEARVRLGELTARVATK